MRRYSTVDEERIHNQGLVREWTRSGLLDPAQGERLAAELRVDFRRTNLFLRAGLALFTGLMVAASVALVIVSLRMEEDIGVALITFLAAIACIGLAEYLVATFRFYRFGVEEALAVGAVVLLGISGTAFTDWLGVGLRGLPSVVGLLLGAAGGFGLYRRFGFVYAAFGSMVCVLAIPFQLELPASIQRSLAAAAMVFVFGVARSKRLTSRVEYFSSDYGQLQAAALAGVYVVLNVHILGSWYTVNGWFYWCTYAVTWVLPLIGVRWGIREKDRELIDVSIVLMLVTLLTNKAYLGWPRRSWDPILLGIVLIAIAIAVRRWLSKSPGGERHGFTPARILDRERVILSRVSTASALARPGPAPSRAEPASTEFGGGRSGGGGGGDSW
jgi:hypothetical protein